MTPSEAANGLVTDVKITGDLTVPGVERAADGTAGTERMANGAS